MKLASPIVIVGCMLSCSITLSTVHPFGNPHSASQADDLLLNGSDVPEAVRTVLQEKCGNCHSQKTRYPLYTYLAPVTWLVDYDIVAARERLDMSQWRFYSDEERISALTRIASEVRSGQMPPRLYALLHENARLSTQEQRLIYQWAKAERRALRDHVAPNSNQSSK